LQCVLQIVLLIPPHDALEDNQLFVAVCAAVCVAVCVVVCAAVCVAVCIAECVVDSLT